MMFKGQSVDFLRNMVYVCHNPGVVYPSREENFSPSQAYPEYGGDISSAENRVYDMVRDCLRGLKLDEQHFGTPEWNPLGDIIKAGDRVLIKPNLVRHANPAGGLDCLVTHAAVLRPIVDYVLLALKGTGKITIGDAPVQGCDFDTLYTAGGYDRLVAYYRAKGTEIAFEDFRGTVARIDASGNLIQTRSEEKDRMAVLVNLGNMSAFAEQTRPDRLRVTNYAPQDLRRHHEAGKHEYLISRSVLEADVIINVPKPKTHRKAGMTGALKNMVGTCVEKEYLPHHTQGSRDEGGDEYAKKSLPRHLRSLAYDWRDTATRDGRYARARFCNAMAMVFSGWIKLSGRGAYDIREGNWDGNNTIWRMILDLNRIVRYADASGVIQPTLQRRMLTIADMIVSGEGNGPLSPSPYEMGDIVAGFDSINVDKVIASVMGIDYREIPCISNTAIELHGQDDSTCTVESNDDMMRCESTEQLDHTRFRHFIMPQGWESV